eukprot:14447-Heterococcus_DN1.PRE.4
MLAGVYQRVCPVRRNSLYDCSVVMLPELLCTVMLTMTRQHLITRLAGIVSQRQLASNTRLSIVTLILIAALLLPTRQQLQCTLAYDVTYALEEVYTATHSTSDYGEKVEVG